MFSRFICKSTVGSSKLAGIFRRPPPDKKFLVWNSHSSVCVRTHAFVCCFRFATFLVYFRFQKMGFLTTFFLCCCCCFRNNFRIVVQCIHAVRLILFSGYFRCDEDQIAKGAFWNRIKFPKRFGESRQSIRPHCQKPVNVSTEKNPPADSSRCCHWSMSAFVETMIVFSSEIPSRMFSSNDLSGKFASKYRRNGRPSQWKRPAYTIIIICIVNSIRLMKNLEKNIFKINYLMKITWKNNKTK